MLSPLTVGMVETRTSTNPVAVFRLMLPSWGNRRSAISMRAMTFKREMMADWRTRNWGGTATSWRMPSMR